jgi:membrane protease subunit HflC
VRRLLSLLILLAGAAVGLLSLGQHDLGPVVLTREGEQRIVGQFGKARKVTAPGLDLRIPLVETIETFPTRLLYLNTEPRHVQTKDEERIVVDSYVIWQVVDPVQFRSSFPGASFPGGLGPAEERIGNRVEGLLRAQIGRYTLEEVLTEKRVGIMRQISKKVDEELRPYGVAVADVRINRTELPPGAEQSVYDRMKTDRESLARKYRAEGEERARRIRADSDREARVIVAQAKRDAEIERGQGDAEAARIYSEAYEGEPGFYEFTRSLEAYKKTLGAGTTLVLSPRAEFFRFLQNGSAPAAPGR